MSISRYSSPAISRRLAGTVLLFATGLSLAACTSSDVTEAPLPIAGAMSVDASTRWVYVNLEDASVVTPTPYSGASDAWDIAFFGTNVMLNGGKAGPGAVLGYCLCQNSNRNFSNADWLALTADGEKSAFDSIVSVPAGANFTSERLTPAITGVYSGTGANTTVNPGVVYFVRYADSTGFAKVHITGLVSPGSSGPAGVTFEYAVASNSDAAFGQAKTVTLDLSNGPRNFDFKTGEASSSGSDWELRFDGYSIRVNGGATGPGKSAAALIPDETFAEANVESTSANAYRSDVYAGVFYDSPFYKYDLKGDHGITPTFDVYLIQRGSRVYKLQIINYYSNTGASRHISLRYSQIGL